MRQKLTKTQKFRMSHLALKNKILSFARCPTLSCTATFRNAMILCMLDSPDSGQPFKYQEQRSRKMESFQTLTSSNLLTYSQVKLSKHLLTQT